ncbi:gamma carbonic anhydrase family protein [Methanonatronarchaeum sp. AMET6-2]|uniref:gamma carbonic anhydrase family protein n=1 Tax=Methanonatronarchaeum sp. AMET6-2 TaxID=2933293 RepID=UPI0012212A43|nr:gamma carbonic anhydrase family protein [Methanonatronarchaeum sp. AMET6-2]RZN63231.1 MAG: gamma carbonic anhydrase family protein [Methanonatronarchaeia archaeon]UOY10508.1 gamma carbonic anhydrase family protein [Methanonatronarchaeum sp. AMET6-2]
MDIDETAYISESAYVQGKVKIGAKSSVWPNATIRADSPIKIGRSTNIQDNAALHSMNEESTTVGDRVTIGHSAVVHGCTIKDECLIGMGAVVLNDAEIGENCIIGASALILEGQEIPSNSLVVGVPGKVVRNLDEDDIKRIKDKAAEYEELTEKYREK